MFGSTAPSLSDIAAVTRGNNNNNDGFGNGNGWWILIILWAIFGWGRGGYGQNDNGGSNGGGNTVVYPIGADLQRGFDTSGIITKLDGINSGICSLGYDQLSQMNGINTNIMQTGFGIQNALNANNIAAMQNANALSTQLSNCCCENREAIAQVRYDMATDTCAITNSINQAARDIQESNCNGFRDLSQQIANGFTNLAMAQKDQQIQELQAQLNICNRDSALQGTASYIINAVRPTPIPTWNVPNPYAYTGNNCGCNCGNVYGNNVSTF